MKKIVLTGGGTAGHVTPHLALLPSLRAEGFEIRYIGSYNGIERRLIEDAKIPYDGISSGKLRRYFDLKNFSDPLRVLKGYSQARKLIKKYRPDIVFSKGGFVAVPVVLAAKHYKVPVIIHESDMTPGLANKICIPAAKKSAAIFPKHSASFPRRRLCLPVPLSGKSCSPVTALQDFSMRVFLLTAPSFWSSAEVWALSP